MYNCILSVCSKWTRSSAVAEKPRNASCHWIFCYSLKVTQGHSKRHCSVGVCKSLLVFHWNYSVYRTVSGIFSVKEWQDLETTGRGRSRSLKMAPFDRSYYHFLLVRYCKYSFVLYRFWVIWRWILSWPWNLGQRSLRLPKLVPFESVGASVVTMAVSLTVYEIPIQRPV